MIRKGETMISAKSLKKSYNEESVIHGIDLSIEEKEYAKDSNY